MSESMNDALPPSPSMEEAPSSGDTTPPPPSSPQTNTPVINSMENEVKDEVEKENKPSSEKDLKRKDYDDRNHNERRLNDDRRSDRRSYDRRDDRGGYRRDDRNYDRRDDYRRDDRRYDRDYDDRNYDRRDDRRYDDRPRSRDRYDNDRRNDRKEESAPQADNIYIPPFKLRKMQSNTTDKSSEEYQKLNWEALKKTLNGIVNKVNSANMANILPELFSENIIRGKGLLVRAIMKAQLASIQFSNVYSALISVVNTRIPEIGELLIKRLVSQFVKSFSRNDKQKCIASCYFIAHLVNQQVASEILAGQLISLLLENPTNDSVELGAAFIKECGKTLLDVAPKILAAVFEAFRNILHDGKIDRRVQYLIEALFSIRKLEFKDYPSIIHELDLVEDDDRITHDTIEISKDIDTEDNLDIFQYDEEFEENEERYKEIKNEILGEGEEEIGEVGEEGPQGSSSSETFGGKEIQTTQEAQKNTLLDPKTKTDEESTDLKRKIYLTIMSSLGFEEAAHKLIKSRLSSHHHMEVCSMIIECCSQERSYLDFFGCLAERFCQIENYFRRDFEDCFKLQYEILHRYETSRLRNIAKLFCHLLVSDSISWSIFSVVKLTDSDTTSHSRIFLKILFQELQGKLGMESLKNKLLHTEALQPFFSGLFPKDNPKVVRFAINFWLLIELPQLAEDLKAYLKEMATKVQSDSDSSDSSDSDSDSSDSSDSD